MKIFKVILGSLVLVGTVTPISVNATVPNNISPRVTAVAGVATIAALFPDEGLAKTVAKELKMNVNEVPKVAQLESVVDLTLTPSVGVAKSLVGIKNLSNLRSLVLLSQEIMNVKELSELLMLQSIHVTTNATTIDYLADLGSVRSLKNLYITAKEATKLPSMTGYSSIKLLSLTVPKATNFEELTKVTNLESISLSGDIGQKDIEIKNFDFLKGLAKLEEIRVSFYEFTNLKKFISFDKLSTLVVSYAGITDISDVSSMSNLKTLGLYANAIVDVKPLANMTNLEYILLNENKINDISPLANLRLTTSIRATEQKIKQSNPYAKDLFLVNPIKGIDGQLVAPKLISHEGIYSAGQIVFSGLAATDVPAFTFNTGEALEVSLPSKWDLDTFSVNGAEEAAEAVSTSFAYSGSVINKFADEETTKPIEETTKPIEETTKPIEETTKPIEETTKPIEEENTIKSIFNDQAVAKAVAQAVGLQVTDSITEAQMLLVTELELFSDTNNIESLEKLKNLASLYIEKAENVKNYQSIAKNTKLTKLGIVGAGENLSSIDFVKSLTELEVFVVVSGSLKDITPLASLQKLQKVMLSDNYIEDVSVIKNLPNLVEFIAIKNMILDISPLAAVKLVNVSHQIILYASEFPGGDTVYAKNKTRGLDGALIAPRLISHNGWYENESINFSGLKNDDKVAYTFNVGAAPVIELPDLSDLVLDQKAEIASATRIDLNEQIAQNQELSFSGTIVYVFKANNQEPPAIESVNTPGTLPATGQNKNEIMLIGSSTIIMGAVMIIIRRKVTQ
ncbi:MAG: Ig-like domain-containing protein [Culicoidibacterales bacterium]